MNQKRELSEAVQKLAGTFLKDFLSVMACTVTAVNEESQTCNCTPIGGDSTTELQNVLLTAEENDGLLLIPEVGSTVLVAITKRNEPFVLMFSNIAKVIIVASTAIQFNDGSLGGLIKIQNLVDRINNLEKAFNAHTHASAATGPPVPPTVDPGNGIPIAPLTQRSDLENDKIKHGV